MHEHSYAYITVRSLRILGSAVFKFLVVKKSAQEEEVEEEEEEEEEDENLDKTNRCPSCAWAPN